MRTISKLAVIAAICAVAAGCSSGSSSKPPLQQPPASAFKVGTCATIAESVLALGRFTYEKSDAKTLTTEERAAMVAEGEKMKAALETAEPAMAEQMMNVLMAIGFVRIRIGDLYESSLLADVEAQRMKLQNTCTTT